MDLAGTSCLVTGGGSGLGEATARALAAKGAKVAVLDLNQQRADAVAKDIKGLAVAADVADAAGIEAALEKIEGHHGAPRLVVHCAGISISKRAVGRTGPHPLEEFEQVVRVNLIGTFNIVRLAVARMQALPVLQDNERGAIVMTASVAAFEGQIGQAAYSASKGGVAALTLPLAREFASLGVRVCSIAPGLFLTPMMRTLPEEVQKALADSSPFPKRLGDPSEYAALAIHIAENPMLNGETIRLDAAVRLAPR